MGFYYNKLVESAVVQNPDDAGVELDAIEAEIVGDDGNESYRDDLDAAEEGTVGDPLEEAFMIMYESEYNYNQLMRRIGMVELSEASHGRDFVLQEADKVGFFENFKQILVKMFTRITEVFNNVVKKLSGAMNLDKAFATKYADKIKNGSTKEWALKNTYKFTNEPLEYKPEAIDYDSYNAYDLNSDLEDAKINIRAKESGLNTDSLDDMKMKLFEKYFVAVDVLKTGDVKADDVINYLKSDSDVKALKKSYDGIKNSYKAALKKVAELEKSSADGEFANAKAITEMIKYHHNVQHAVYAVTLKAAKARRSQYRSLAHKWFRLGGGKETEGATGTPAVKTESSIFGGLAII